MDFGRAAVRIAQHLPPELAHRLAIRALALGLAPVRAAEDDPILACEAFGRRLPNPLGIAAGFDKDAEAIGPALRLGFGFVEAGGVTPLPQPGNPRPRLFRLPEDRALINRFGFNSAGLDPFRRRLEAFRARDPDRNRVVGVNLAKNKTSEDAAADYAAGAAALAGLADFLTINVSSPNTPGLRALQQRAELAAVLRRVADAIDWAAPVRRPALLVKVSPDLSAAERAELADAALATTGADGRRVVDGLVVANTTTARPASLQSAAARETGGLSGAPVAPLSLAALADFRRLTEGRIALVACGGVASGADAYVRIRAGASLVQLYTALVYEGPGLIGRIKRELAAALRADGFRSLGEAVGTAGAKALAA